LFDIMSQITDKLIEANQYKQKIEKTDELLKVSSVVSKAAVLYEKIRNAVDYQEEHLIRKNATFRILKRKLLYEKVVLENYLLDKYHHENLSKQLMQELVRGGYIKEKVPMSLVNDVDKVIQKYNKLVSRVKELEGNLDKKEYRYFMDMAAFEIENLVAPPVKEKALVNAMFAIYNPRIINKDSKLPEKEKELQVYLSAYKTLYKWDESMLRTLLFNLYYPEWKTADDKMIIKIANNITKIRTELDKQLHHPIGKQITRILAKKAVIMWLLEDIIEDDPAAARAIFSNEEDFEAELKKAINKRNKGVRVKLRRGVIRSIIYVFFTKMLLAIAIEFPMDYYLVGAINYTSAAINIGFPPVLMFLVAVMIQMPKKENTARITEECNLIVLGKGESKKYKLKPLKKRGKVVNFLLHSIYTATFIFSLMVIFWALNKYLDFNVFSSLLFVFFLTLVSFFAIRIRKPVLDLLAIDRKESTLGTIMDFFSLPFMTMGRYMSVKFSKINVVAMFLDVIIEAPYKLLIEVFEDIFGFIKEKKEDVMDE